ncbi:MAG: LptF/LptG family permease, partial [Winogradskyella sp.]|nr:LptF/LptG family permease [Winogradskyella sp.]NNF84909.1 YjgP/YjgQ family permease [Winogradskyella sp.]
MKILDRYILTTYLKTFLSVFVILMFIFVLQTIWLYITELAGKDLDLIVVGKFLLYFAPKMVPLVLPLTILLASIMVFGNFAENYEFAAMKSTGISLQRAMRSLSVFIFGLAIIAFFFANNVIPWSEFKSYNLRRNIAKVKPAMAIAEGQFNEVGNINIKVDKKSGDRGQFLEGVVIHEKSNTLRGNYKVIISETGELISSEDSNILQLELRNGNYYEEIVNRDARKNVSKPHARSYFDKYIINVDLEILNNQDLDEDTYTGRYNMLDIAGLNYTIDSLYVDKNK